MADLAVGIACELDVHGASLLEPLSLSNPRLKQVETYIGFALVLPHLDFLAGRGHLVPRKESHSRSTL